MAQKPSYVLVCTGVLNAAAIDDSLPTRRWSDGLLVGKQTSAGDASMHNRLGNDDMDAICRRLSFNQEPGHQATGNLLCRNMTAFFPIRYSVHI
jgi:hypothetical protein